jgi:predicted dienelactone hydrolase
MSNADVNGVSRDRERNNKQGHRWQRWPISLALGIIPAALGALPLEAAERIDFEFGPLNFKIPIAPIEKFAKEGTVGSELDFFAGRLSPEDLKYARDYLQFRADFTQLQVAQFFYSSMGETLLSYLGDLIQTNNRHNGSRAIRAALILAAGSPEGLTPINFLRYFPTTGIRLNTNAILRVTNEIVQLTKTTNAMVSEISQIAAQEAKSEPPLDLSMLRDLRVPGTVNYAKQTITLKGVGRSDRTLIVDLYLPEVSSTAPLMAISHGLGSGRNEYEILAQLLASNGVAVAVLEHPGSDGERMQALFRGRAKEVFDASEFIDRPRDVTYVLDDLNQRFPGKLNLQQVGIVGHSFGGYTALAVAGATIDFEGLANDCSGGITSVNISLVLQCEALKLPRQDYDFKDKRIKLAIALNPVSRSIFGAKGMRQIDIPVVIASGSEDVVTPLVLEQVQPFTWLTTAERYLALGKGVQHVADIRSLIGTVSPSLGAILPPQPKDRVREQARAFIVAFAKVYIANQPEYRPYLQSSYAIAVTEESNAIRIIRSLSESQFDRIITSTK